MPDAVDQRHYQLIEWLRLEWPYQQSKFKSMGEDEPARTPEVGLGHAANYRTQALLMGLDSERGRQRLAKAIATEIAVLTYACKDFGDLPEPGHSSSEDTRKWIGMPK